MAVKKNDTVDIRITDLGTHAEGIGKADGYTLFVKNTLPGEVIRVVVTKTKKNYGYGKALEIISPSPYRTTPLCPAAGKCGGCTLQHMDYKAQLEYKKEKIEGNLRHIGGFEDISVENITGMDYPYRYRNKAQYPVKKDKNGIVTGFYSLGSHNIVSCEDCLIGSRANSAILEAIRIFAEKNNISVYDEESGRGIIRHILIREGFSTGEIMVCLIVNCRNFRYRNELVKGLSNIENISSIVINYNTSRTNVIMGERCETIYGNSYITDCIGDLRFRISAPSFFQVNPEQTLKLYTYVAEFADLHGSEIVIDAYCGTGSISLFLAQKAKKVYGFEVVDSAIEDARINAEINGIENAEFIPGRAEETVPKLCSERGVKPDVIVVDPPRKGCDKALIDMMRSAAPEKIVYVSCDSATLARDLKILCEDNKYRIEKVRGVDMFPHSVNVETVCLLSRADIKHQTVTRN